MKGAASLVFLAGCLSKPELTPRDADVPVDASCTPTQPGAPGLQATSSSTPTVTWPGGMQLRFGNPSQNIAMPDFFSLTGTNLLAQPQPSQCGTEDQAGAAIYPVFTASPTSLAADYAISTLDRIIVGPAYAEYTVHWARDFVCGGLTSRASGNTIFSLFPDGRIVRNDTITPTNVATTLDASCRCTPATMFFVTSYLALQRDQLAWLATEGTAEAPVPTVDTEIVMRAGGCVVEGGGAPGRLAVVFEDPGLPRGRIRSVGAGAAAELVFVHDLFSGPALAANVSYGGRTTMLMSAASGRPCTQLLAAATATWPPISIGPTGSAGGIVNSTPQTVYVDPTEYAGPITVTASNGDVPPGLVISVRLPGTSITTSRTDGVTWQREADGRFIVWFRNSITASEPITITPEC